MKFLRSVLPMVAPAALLGALAYTQIGWHGERKARVSLYERFRETQALGRYPMDGAMLSTSGLQVVNRGDTIALSELVKGREAVIYFERLDCPICAAFGAAMDTLLPAWRDSFLVVRPYEAPYRDDGTMLDSVSSMSLLGVPAVLVVDKDGIVRHAVRAGLRQVVRVLQFLGVPSPTHLLLPSPRPDALSGAP